MTGIESKNNEVISIEDGLWFWTLIALIGIIGCVIFIIISNMGWRNL